MTILAEYPQGLSEFELLKKLQETEQEAFPENLFKNSHAMFQAHFLLFHALYRLDDELRHSTGQGVEINVLRIRLQPGQISDSGLPSSIDPLRDYYLDLNNLKMTSAEEVEKLLGQFWVRYFANERRSEALAVLGVADPVSDAEITRCYRRMAMDLHPDRGGGNVCFQQLQDAIAVLRRC